LNEIFSAFDLLAEKRGVEKIKTIGDRYVAAGGVSVPQPDHAEAGALLALDMREEIERFNHQYDTSVRIRIGICTGPVVAGVIGRKRFAYDIWSETVNCACRMEITCEAGKIQIAESTYDRLKGRHPCEKNANAESGERGDAPAYWLTGR
jgi:class 3 adenylate cyclase